MIPQVASVSKNSKWLRLTTVIVLLMALPAITFVLSCQRGNQNSVTVTRIIDGDTIEVNIGGRLYDVRYIGVDTPEPNQPFGHEAAEKNAELLSGNRITLEKDVSETDRYGRLLRYVYADGIFVNAELVRQGYAQVATYPPDVKFQNHFLELQREAQESGKGLWAGSSPALSEKPAGLYVGSNKSDKYHYPDCSSAKQIYPENRIWFNSVAEARAKGYVPCKVCKPPD